jgi:hypothetical protein
LDFYNISIDYFSALNPAVGADCANLWPDYRYCIKASNAQSVASSTRTSSQTTALPGPHPSSLMQKGQPPDCERWYECKPGDSCGSVAEENNISLDQFYLWNPAVSKDCSTGFWSGYDYCVGTAESAAHVQSSTSHAPTTAAGSSAAPTPNQANNAISSCSKYAIAQDGDYCSVS